MAPDSLSITSAALADPTRRALLERLAQGEASVGELAGPFDMSLPAISQHLKVPETAGLMVRGCDAQWRPCQLTVGPRKDATDWLEHCRPFWEQSFDRLAEYLHRVQRKEKKHGRKK